MHRLDQKGKTNPRETIELHLVLLRQLSMNGRQGRLLSSEFGIKVTDISRCFLYDRQWEYGT